MRLRSDSSAPRNISDKPGPTAGKQRFAAAQAAPVKLYARSMSSVALRLRVAKMTHNAAAGRAASAQGNAAWGGRSVAGMIPAVKARPGALMS